jgi:8-hydroxy-5-deazaflavin:NADPH oxidoreductase
MLPRLSIRSRGNAPDICAQKGFTSHTHYIHSWDAALLFKMQIGIVNAGNIGLSLAMAWVRRGYHVMLSKDTHPEKLEERARHLASNLGLDDAEVARLSYGSLVDAAKFGEVVILSIYFPRLSHVLNELQSHNVSLAGKTVIETINPLNVDANFNHYHDINYMAQTSVTEDIQRAFPEAILFKAFSTIPATLLDPRKWDHGYVPPIIFLGGTTATLNTVRQLITDAGFRAQFAGHSLADAGLMERLGIFLHRLAENEYKGDLHVIFDVVHWEASMGKQDETSLVVSITHKTG